MPRDCVEFLEQRVIKIEGMKLVKYVTRTCTFGPGKKDQKIVLTDERDIQL